MSARVSFILIFGTIYVFISNGAHWVIQGNINDPYWEGPKQACISDSLRNSTGGSTVSLYGNAIGI